MRYFPVFLDLPWYHQLWLWPLLAACCATLFSLTGCAIVLALAVGVVYGLYCIAAWIVVLPLFHGMQRLWVCWRKQEPGLFNLKHYMRDQGFWRGAVKAPAWIPVAVITPFVIMTAWSAE